VRGFCPCATCQGHRAGTRYQEGGSDELRELQTVGNYALALTWGDGHTGGIYSFAYLRRLGELLRQQGLPALIAAGSLPAEE